MKSRRVFMGLLASMPWLPRAAFADSLPTPVTKTEFDVSRKGNVAVIDFQINRPRSYVIALLFTYAGRDDEDRVLKLVGGFKDHNPGIDIPVRLKLMRLLKDGNVSAPLFDDDVVTKKSYVHYFDSQPFYGKFSREILTVNLEPGRYRVEARTQDDNAAFAGTPSYLLIDYYAQLQFVPNSFVPNDSEHK